MQPPCQKPNENVKHPGCSTKTNLTVTTLFSAQYGTQFNFTFSPSPARGYNPSYVFIRGYRQRTEHDPFLKRETGWGPSFLMNGAFSAPLSQSAALRPHRRCDCDRRPGPPAVWVYCTRCLPFLPSGGRSPPRPAFAYAGANVHRSREQQLDHNLDAITHATGPPPPRQHSPALQHSPFVGRHFPPAAPRRVPGTERTWAAIILADLPGFPGTRREFECGSAPLTDRARDASGLVLTPPDAPPPRCVDVHAPSQAPSGPTA